jgi:hypothetical protein
MPSDMPEPRADQPRVPRNPRDEHPQLADTASFPAAPRGASAPADADAARPMDADERRSVEITSGPAGALAGAAAGATAGLVSLVGGPIAMGIGAIVGAMTGGAGGWLGGQATTDVRYDESHDAHYRALYEGGVATDRGFDSVRPAYQLGHVAAHNPQWRGREFSVIEPELRRTWDGHLRGHDGLAWDAVRPYVRDAYGHARSEGAGAHRDLSVIGSAGSAVDPDELARAQHGQPSTDYAAPGAIAVRDDDLAGTDDTGAARPGLGERPEIDANTARHQDVDYR